MSPKHQTKKRQSIIKKAFFLSLVIMGVLLIAGYFLCLEKQDFKVVFLDVGQGDASLLKLPNRKVILIDGGPNNLVLKRLGENLPFYQRRLDLVILSHFHEDHIAGLIEIMERYRVIMLVYKEAESQTKDMANAKLLSLLLQKAENNKTKIVVLKNIATLNYSRDCFLKLLNPLSLKVKANDNNSLIAKLVCHNLTFLFSGDNELAVEEALLKSNYDLSAQVFKASHHGSKTSNSLEFLRKINPKLIVISSGYDNKFNHPSQEVLKTIKDLGIKVKRTDEDSSIVIRGD